MRLKKLIVLSLAACMVVSTASCGEKKPDKPTGVFITYGEEDQYYGFVDPYEKEVFMAELPLDNIKDKDGSKLAFEDLNSGDTLELTGAGIETNSLPPIYAGITEAVRVKEGNNRTVKKYEPMVEEMLAPEADPSEIPMIAIETTQSLGMITTGISAVSFEWNYKDADGKKQSTVSSEAEGTEFTVVEMEKETEEANVYISAKPESLKLLKYDSDNKDSVKLEETKDGYEISLEAGKTYEFQGKWKNGDVNYKFVTKMRE